MIKERTRINLVLKSDQDTEISDYGPAATDEEVAVFYEMLRRHLNAGLRCFVGQQAAIHAKIFMNG